MYTDLLARVKFIVILPTVEGNVLASIHSTSTPLNDSLAANVSVDMVKSKVALTKVPTNLLSVEPNVIPSDKNRKLTPNSFIFQTVCISSEDAVQFNTIDSSLEHTGSTGSPVINGG